MQALTETQIESQSVTHPAIHHTDLARTRKLAALDIARLHRVVLTGFMGAGKSTIGRILADRLGWEFLDLDTYIEARAGLTVPDIFAIHGEQRFRELESQALASALGRQNVVLALGGGAPEVLTNRLLIEQTPATATIFLDAPFSTLFDRCMMQALNAPAAAPDTQPGQIRPLLADPAAAETRFLARRPVYRRLARLIVDTARLTTEDTVTGILSALQAHRSSARP
jgi:shikimate kinase